MVAIPDAYALQDDATDPGALAGLYDDLPGDLADLRDVVANLIVHVSWAARYGIAPGVPLPRETQPIAERLRLIQAAFAGSLLAERPPGRRTFGTCRDFALLLCSVLRHRAIPARVRCGFATYFAGGRYEDHWICEHWSARERRWVRSDAQLDRLQREQLRIGFDCADMPDGVFLTGAAAWAAARAGSPDDFGHAEARGLRFLRVNLHRDLLALVNQPMSRWDEWRSAAARDQVLSSADIAACDDLAGAIEAAACAADGFAVLQERAARARVPPWQG